MISATRMWYIVTSMWHSYSMPLRLPTHPKIFGCVQTDVTEAAVAVSPSVLKTMLKRGLAGLCT